MMSSDDLPDLPRWVAHLTVLAVSLSIPVSLFVNGSNYLTSWTGYADGGDMYSHIVEALHVKSELQRGSMDFWFAGCTLGYPMFLAYQPLPCLFVGSLMAVTEWVVSPLLLFRWLFVLVLCAMPCTWYIGVRKLGMSRLEASFAALALFSIQSWRQFGLEIVAFQQLGLFTQAYGMAFLPLTVGQIYQYVVRGEGTRDVAHALIMLTFLSHSFFGMYVVMVTGTMVLVNWIINLNCRFLHVQVYALPLLRAADVHLRSLLFICWWLIPLLANFQYAGGLPWKSESENGYQFQFLVRQFMTGEIFDHGRKFSLITLLVIGGIATTCLCRPHSGMHHRQHLHVWILVSFLITSVLLLGRTTFGFLYELIPFHSELEVIRYINGVHFFGLLLAAIAGARFLLYICSFVSRLSTFKQILKVDHALVAFILAISLQIGSISNLISSHVTITEVDSDFLEFVAKLREHPLTGRVYGQESLGTGGAWDLAFVPYIASRPGVLTFSRGYHDGLSLFYLESFRLNNNTVSIFPDLMRLYNIHFLVSSGITFDQEFLNTCQLQVHSTRGSSTILARSATSAYGYFEFIHTPGTVQGNLKRIRQVLLKSLGLFSSNVLFVINPTLKTANNPIASIYVRSNNSGVVGLTEDSLAMAVVVQWRINNLPVEEKLFLELVNNSYRKKAVRSRVVEEAVCFNEYSAIVDIPERASRKDIFSAEHLLLKVTYHPYWSCRHKPVSGDTQLGVEGTDTSGEDWLDTDVYHVTPNLMSIVLPAGRYHVVFRYCNPLYQKIGFVLFLLILPTLILKQFLRQRVRKS